MDCKDQSNLLITIKKLIQESSKPLPKWNDGNNNLSKSDQIGKISKKTQNVLDILMSQRKGKNYISPV